MMPWKSVSPTMCEQAVPLLAHINYPLGVRIDDNGEDQQR